MNINKLRHKILAISLSICMLIPILLSSTWVFAGSEGSGGDSGSFSKVISNTQLPDLWDETVLIRFYPIVCVETILPIHTSTEIARANYLMNLDRRWEYAGGFSNLSTDLGQGLYFKTGRWREPVPLAGNAKFGKYVMSHIYKYYYRAIKLNNNK